MEVLPAEGYPQVTRNGWSGCGVDTFESALDAVHCAMAGMFIPITTSPPPPGQPPAQAPRARAGGRRATPRSPSVTPATQPSSANDSSPTGRRQAPYVLTSAMAPQTNGVPAGCADISPAANQGAASHTRRAPLRAVGIPHSTPGGSSPVRAAAGKRRLPRSPSSDGSAVSGVTDAATAAAADAASQMAMAAQRGIGAGADVADTSLSGSGSCSDQDHSDL